MNATHRLPHFAPATATRLGRTVPVAMLLLLWTSLGAAAANAQASLFHVTRGSDPTLLSFSSATGSATVIGPVSGGQVLSLATPSSSLLYGGTVNGNLLQIDPLTGAVTPIGFTGRSDPLFDLAFLNDTLYGVQGPLGGIQSLLRIDPLTGSGTVLSEITDLSGNYLAARGLTVYDQRLLTADAGLGAGGDLFVLDPAGGPAANFTPDGGVGIGINGLVSLNLVGETLYAVNEDPTDPNSPDAPGLYTIDLTTARTDFVAPVAVIPEPGTLALVAAGLATAGGMLPRRRRLLRRAR